MRGHGMMTGAQLIECAWSVASALAGAQRCQPFGPEYEVFKVGGKIFMMTTVVRGTPIVTLKCEPEHAVALREEFATVTSGYHMNKRHWTSLAAGRGVTKALIEELVENAYLLVVDGLPRDRRPGSLQSSHRTSESSQGKSRELVNDAVLPPCAET
jgi:predicted DNA-binding protein (MmcQ/YjbR family)